MSLRLRCCGRPDRGGNLLRRAVSGGSAPRQRPAQPDHGLSLRDQHCGRCAKRESQGPAVRELYRARTRPGSRPSWRSALRRRSAWRSPAAAWRATDATRPASRAAPQSRRQYIDHRWPFTDISQGNPLQRIVIGFGGRRHQPLICSTESRCATENEVLISISGTRAFSIPATREKARKGSRSVCLVSSWLG
jgi:hypothetical protein